MENHICLGSSSLEEGRLTDGWVTRVHWIATAFKDDGMQEFQ